MDKRLLIISTAAIVGFVAISYLTLNKPIQTDYPDQKILNTTSNKSSISDHKKGKGKNVLIEYSDLQCPACKMMHEYIEAEKKKDPEFKKLIDDQFTFVYRHFPLTNIHKNAEAAAFAAEAAAIQGKFYEFVDRAFATQAQWSDAASPIDHFTKIAKDLGIDDKKFVSDISADAVKKKVSDDTAMALKGAVDSTPTFFANGVKITGYKTFEDFKNLLQNATKTQTK